MRFYCLLFSLLLSMGLSAQTTYYVSTTGNEANNGLSWDSPKKFIKHVLAIANDGDTIKVAQGSYVDGGITTVTKSVTIKGGYNTVTDTQDYSKPSELTRMSGVGRIMAFTTPGKVLNLDNIAFVNGNSARGGALFAVMGSANEATALNITNCVFNNNEDTSDFGAAIMAMRLPVKLFNCVFSNNKSKLSGAVFIKYGKAEVTNCLFYNNTSPDDAPALYYYGTSLKLVNSTFAYNSATDENVAQGGALGLYSDANVTSNVEISNSIFWGNTSAKEASQIYVLNDVKLHLTSNIIQDGRDDISIGARSAITYATSEASDIIDENPQFIDTDNNNYRLNYSSIAINAGTNDKAADIASDLDGRSRIIDGNIDLGAYEAKTMTVDNIKYFVLSDTPATLLVYGMTNAKDEVIIPATISDNETTYTVTEIAPQAFQNNTGIQYVDIPSTVTNISETTFESCYVLSKIVCRIKTPQTFMTNAFSNTNAVIYVPAVSVADYAAQFDNVGAFVDMKKEYVTFCSTGDISFTGNTAIKAFIASSYNETTKKISLQDVASLPHSTGAILHAEPGLYLFDTTTTPVSVATNLLKGVTVDTAISETEGDKTNYLLSNGEFCKANAGTLAAGKAYLQLPTSQAGAKYIGMIEEETTNIDFVISDNANDSVYYTLDGIRIEKPTQKGVYINNGRKVIIK